MPALTLRIETVRFAGDASSPALHRLRVEGRAAEIPEWQRLPARRDPVVIVATRLTATRGRIPIVATFGRRGVGAAGAKDIAVRASIHATDLAVTPTIDSRPVNIRVGASPARAAFVIRTTGRAVDVGDVTIRWEQRQGTTWRRIGDTTHRVAITVAAPTPPWTAGAETPELSHPSWRVIESACRSARGARSAADVATALTRACFAGGFGARTGRLLYQAGGGVFASNVQSGAPYFDCTAFLDAIEAGETVIDCHETTAAVVTLANALGARLVPCAWRTPESIRSVRLLRHTACVGNAGFQLHEIAQSAPAPQAVWDGSLMMCAVGILQALEPVEIASAERYFTRLLTSVPLGGRAVVSPVRPVRAKPASSTSVKASRLTKATSKRFGLVPSGPPTPSVDRWEGDRIRLEKGALIRDVYLSTTRPNAQFRLLIELARLAPAMPARLTRADASDEVIFRALPDDEEPFFRRVPILAATFRSVTVVMRATTRDVPWAALERHYAETVRKYS